MKKHPSIYVATLLLFAACSASRLVTPTETTLQKARQSYPDATLAQLTEGKDIFQAHCNDCHSYKESTKRSVGTLMMEVPVMVKKVNEKKGKNTISPKQEEALLRYLTTVSTFERDQMKK